MSILESYAAHATLPVSDMNRAKAWYKDKLGLTPKEEDTGGVYYETGGAGFGLFEPPFAGTAKNTQMEWTVPDVKATVAELKANGVTFDTFEMEGLEWEDDVANMDGFLGAWFKDSEGNTLALTQDQKS